MNMSVHLFGKIYSVNIMQFTPLIPLQIRPLYPQFSTLQEKLTKIRMYDDVPDEVPEQIGPDLSLYVEEYKVAIDKLIEIQNELEYKKSEIQDFKKLANGIDNKNIHTEKLLNIIDDFCQDANLDEIQTKYKEARREVAKYRHLFSVCKSSELLNRYVCYVCVESTVDVCMVPCGHVLCNKCSTSIRSNCPFCRSTIQSKLKMYLE
jgi:hypothetical protein